MTEQKLFIGLYRPEIVRHDGKVFVREAVIRPGDLKLRGQVSTSREELEGDTRFDREVFEVKFEFAPGSIFEVTENSDQTEGRGRMVRVGLFSSFFLAFQVAAGRGGMGVGYGDINLLQPKALNVFDSIEEFKAASPEDKISKQGVVTLMDYFGLNTDYFSALDPRQGDPDFELYRQLKARFEG